jgi:two-component system OmpR family response regulator
MKQVLVVDDEARIREVVSYALGREGYAVVELADGPEAVERIGRGDVDAVVLDVMLKQMDGLEVVRRVRALPTPAAKTPVLFLSARAEEIDRVVGLELGGDDYLVKPFSPRELVARVRALIRRSDGGGGAASATVDEATKPSRHGPLTIDPERHEIACHGAVVPLTPTEFGVLAALFDRPGVVLSRGQLMQRAYRYDNLVTERTIDTHVRRIRAKFRPHALDPIATVHGVGYKAGPLDANDKAAP